MAKVVGWTTKKSQLISQGHGTLPPPTGLPPDSVALVARTNDRPCCVLFTEGNACRSRRRMSVTMSSPSPCPEECFRSLSGILYDTVHMNRTVRYRTHRTVRYESLPPLYRKLGNGVIPVPYRDAAQDVPNYRAGPYRTRLPAIFPIAVPFIWTMLSCTS